jgi:serine phosphatase RsbU (regulator of sigma subunit)
MAPRDSMCWVTDGVLEQEIQKPLSVEQKSVGEERCGKWLVEAIGKSPLQATSQNIVDEFISFYQTQVTHEQADDQTLVMLKSAYSTSG